MSSSSFRDLRVWQEAMKLTAEIYRGTVGVSAPRTLWVELANAASRGLYTE